MKAKILLLTTLIFLFSEFNGYAQGGSNYSIYGFGDIIHNSSAVYDALGGSAIAVPKENSINLLNPAMWGFISQTRIRAGYRFNQNLVQTENSHLFQNNGKVDGISYALAIDTAKGASIVFGFNTYTTVNYLISKKSIVEIEGYQLYVDNQYQGSGGLSQAFIGASFRPISFLYLGASLLGNFGTINSYNRTLVTGSYASSAITERNDYFLGMGFRFGLAVKPLENLLIGWFTETHHKANLKSYIRNYYELTLDTTFTTESKAEIPTAYGFGFSYRNGRTLITADFVQRDFKKVAYNLPPRVEFQAEPKVSVGVSFLGSRSLFASFAQRTTYNLGAYYKRLYAKIDGNSIDEYAFTFGFEFPIVGSATLNAGFVFGGRIPQISQLPKEYFGRMILEITLGETWFVPFRRE